MLFLLLQLFNGLGWSALAVLYYRSSKKTPVLPRQVNDAGRYPKVSVILPARNEEEYVKGSLQSLSQQKYPDFEVVAVDDNSTDATAEIMREVSSIEPMIRFTQAPPPPQGWTGKNWACEWGFRKAEGEILLFTDADTFFHEDTLKESVAYLLEQKLDALTLIPRIALKSRVSKAVQPLLNVVMSTVFSPLSVNNPKSKLAYFWGSYILISRSAYRIVGGHERIRSDLVEDRALGRLAKQAGLKIRMIDGSHRVSAVWSRDAESVWRNLERVLYSSVKDTPVSAIRFLIGTIVVLLLPYVALPLQIYSKPINVFGVKETIGVSILIYSVLLSLLCSTYEAKARLRCNPAYGLGAPLTVIFILSTLLSSFLRRGLKLSVNWKERLYR